MSTLSKAFNSLSDLTLWFNGRSGLSLKMSNVPELIPLRWTYFRDNWDFILPTVQKQIYRYVYPDKFTTQLNEFTNYIKIHRNSSNVNPFSSSTILTDFYSVWDNIEVNSIPITKEENTIIQNKINRIQAFIKTDFVKLRNNLAAARDEIADITGTEDSEYNAIFERSSVPVLRSISLSDMDNMQSFQNSIKAVDFILANTSSLNTVNIDPFALARVNANNPDVNIQTGKSGKLVRMFFGDNLQALAYRYLGDPDRWIEIAIANGLKPPYIDEIGTTVPLSTNGSGNQVNVSGIDGLGNSNREKFYINQAIFLQSNSHRSPDQRIVINIREIPVSGDLILELSGTPNLNQYTTADSATIRVFLPNTINSNFFVLIPSTQNVNTVNNNDIPFFLQSKMEDEKRAGIDLAVNSSGDLVFTSDSDLQLSFGLANAIQAVQLKMLNEKGQNTRHPDYGLPNVVGTKTNQPTLIQQTIITGINDMIAEDVRFDRVESLNVTVGTGVANISLVVRMAGSGSLVPISFTINTG